MRNDYLLTFILITSPLFFYGCWYNPHCSDICQGSTVVTIRANEQFTGAWQRFVLETERGKTECVFDPQTSKRMNHTECFFDNERYFFKLNFTLGNLGMAGSFAVDWLKIATYDKSGNKQIESYITTKSMAGTSYSLCESVSCPRKLAEVTIQ